MKSEVGMQMDDRPIGVFDSGLGGLTVLKAVRKLLPKENIVYFGDCGRAPYGVKSKKTIINFTFQDTRFLMSKGIKLLVIACNTSSAYSYEQVRDKLDIPVIEVIGPGARAAVKTTKNAKVGVIGTAATVNSKAYEIAIHQLNQAIEVSSKACPLFVPLVEEGAYWWQNEVTEKIAETYLAHFKELQIDSLVLGCTHYPLLSAVIKKVLGTGITLISSADEVAISVKDTLEKQRIYCEGIGRPNLSFYTSDSVEKFEPLCSAILGEFGETASIENIDIEKY